VERLITGANYGTTNSYQYKFNIEPDDYEWEGLINQAPLALVFCGDDTYLKVTEHLFKLDSLDDGGHYKDTTLYFKNADERYFFKLFGEQRFMEMDSVTYIGSKEKCGEVSVPIM
jgi:hypothetical protein